MDALDLKILGILDSDPRRPYAEIARELDVSQRPWPIACDDSRAAASCAARSVHGSRPSRFNISAFVRLRTKPRTSAASERRPAPFRR